MKPFVSKMPFAQIAIKMEALHLNAFHFIFYEKIM